MNPRLRAVVDRGRDLRRRVRKWTGVRTRRLRAAAERLEARTAPPLLLLAGWAAVTAGVAELFGAAGVVWPIGAGLLAWGLYGYRTLWLTVWYGLVALRKMRREHPEDR